MGIGIGIGIGISINTVIRMAVLTASAAVALDNETCDDGTVLKFAGGPAET